MIIVPALAFVLVSCTGKEADSGSAEVAQGPSSEENRENSEKKVTSEGGASDVTPEAEKDEKTVFKNTVDWLKKNGGEPGKIDLETVKFRPGKRSVSVCQSEKPDELLPFRSPEEFIVKRVRLIRSDNGAVMDFDVYSRKDSGKPYLIEGTEYGTRRETVRYYFDPNGMLSYVFAWQDEPIGTLDRLDRDIPGKRCSFAGDRMTDCEITDAEDKYNGSYSAKDYSKFDSFIKKQYDELEKNYVNQAYCIKNAVDPVPGFARVYGYAADEFGGTLKGTEVELSSAEHDYRQTTEADDDGFFAFYVPVNDLDWYNLKFHYGDYLPSEIDDIHIRPLTVDYCAGVAYMAPPGELDHEQCVYLLNINEKPDEELSKGEYEVTLTFDGTKAELSLYGLILGDKVREVAPKLVRSGEKTVYSFTFDGKEDEDLKIVVRDEKGIAGDNLYSYDMSLSGALVKIYDENGLEAAFPVPAGAAGVTWECAEILSRRIIPWNNYYQEALGWQKAG